MSTISTLQQILDELDIVDADIRSIIQSAVSESISIKEDGVDSTQVCGNSRIGGLPDAPKDWTWPVSQEKGTVTHYGFLAQFNFAHIPPLHCSPLPKTGLLSFFIGVDEPSYNIKNHVYYFPETNTLTQKAPPNHTTLAPHIDGEGALNGSIYPASKVTFSKSLSLDDHHLSQNKIIRKAEDNGSIELLNLSEAFSFYQGQTHLLGTTEAWATDPREEAYLYRTGQQDLHFHTHKSLDSIDEEISKASAEANLKLTEHLIHIRPRLLEWHKNRNRHVSAMNQWRLLFKLSSLSNSQMCWWDAGYLQFMIHNDDLRSLQFSNTYCDLASS